MPKHIGCKHLDYDGEYINCHIETIQPEGWKYWVRDNPPYEGAPVKVQFCGKGRGRINEIFACINEGEMSCFEKQEPDVANPCCKCGKEWNDVMEKCCEHCGNTDPF